jgi:hypothetical protein
VSTTTPSNANTVHPVELPVDLRDYFAAKVLAMLMHPDAKDYSPEETARRAYLFADAMLKAREAGNG